jgi:chorismate mutase
VAEAKAIRSLVEDLSREAEILQEALDEKYNSGDPDWDPEQGWRG